MSKELQFLESELRKKVDLKYKEGMFNYFKEPIKNFGVRSKQVDIIGKTFFAQKKNEWNFEQFLELAEELYKTGIMENSSLATLFIEKNKKFFEKKHFKTFEAIIEKYLDNWGQIDGFCTHPMAEFLKKFPEFSNKVVAWHSSKNLWKRRAACVSFIPIARKSKQFDKEIFKIAELLRKDKEDLVQKGAGWLLKEKSNKNKKMVIQYLMKVKKDTPRLVLRYAAEKLSKAERQRILC
ncbi:MAG: DNA alkylation repair protein [archaeon]|nr:DNA alkylation repair protein [archaeon]